MVARCIYCHRPDGIVCAKCVHRHQEAWKSLCPVEYRGTNIEAIRKMVGGQVDHVVGRKYSNRGLCVFGAAGLGKTRATWFLAKEWFNAGYTPYAFHLAGAGTSLSAQVSEAFRRGEYVEWVDQVASAGFLLWDDFDKDQLTGRAEEAAFSLIELFTSNKKPILVTTQATGDELAAKFKGERGSGILRRVREFCDGVQFRTGGAR